DFIARVAAVKQRHLDEQPLQKARWEAHVAKCKANPDDDSCDHGRVRMRIPPAPLDDKRPKAPKGDVEWIPGYWSFDDALDDFAWIAGTYIVRAKPAAPEPVAKAPEPVAVP